MIDKINNLSTEQSNINTTNIDTASAIEIVTMINQEDKQVANAVEKELPNIALAAKEISNRFLNGGRIIYIGAGSSGRMGVLDAVELTPTYNVSNERAIGIIAGGEKAMYSAVEGAEDSIELGVSDLEKINLNANDSVIGIAASGRTPYTISALEYANKVGAYTIAISSNKNSQLAKVANVSIAPETGAEAITGSTRMKSGTAQKMVINMLSTAAMVMSGRVYKNYMVHVQSTNDKLVERAINMIQTTTNANREEAEKLFVVSGNSVATSIVMHEQNVSKEVAEECLERSKGHVRQAIEILKEK